MPSLMYWLYADIDELIDANYTEQEGGQEDE